MYVTLLRLKNYYVYEIGNLNSFLKVASGLTFKHFDEIYFFFIYLCFSSLTLADHIPRFIFDTVIRSLSVDIIMKGKTD